MGKSFRLRAGRQLLQLFWPGYDVIMPRDVILVQPVGYFCRLLDDRVHEIFAEVVLFWKKLILLLLPTLIFVLFVTKGCQLLGNTGEVPAQLRLNSQVSMILCEFG